MGWVSGREGCDFRIAHSTYRGYWGSFGWKSGALTGYLEQEIEFGDVNYHEPTIEVGSAIYENQFRIFLAVVESVGQPFDWIVNDYGVSWSRRHHSFEVKIVFKDDQRDTFDYLIRDTDTSETLYSGSYQMNAEVTGMVEFTGVIEYCHSEGLFDGTGYHEVGLLFEWGSELPVSVPVPTDITDVSLGACMSHNYSLSPYWEINIWYFGSQAVAPQNFVASVVAQRWMIPTSHNDPSNDWSKYPNWPAEEAYDGDEETFGTCNVEYGLNWTGWLELLIEPLPCSKVRYLMVPSNYTTLLQVEVKWDGTWHFIYQGSAHADAYVWRERELGGSHIVSGMRLRFYRGSATNKCATDVYEVGFYRVATSDYIRLTWELPPNEKTLIRKGTVAYPTTIEEGELLYFGIAERYDDLDTIPGVRYYYSAWGWHTEGGYSEGFVWTDIELPKTEYFGDERLVIIETLSSFGKEGYEILTLLDRGVKGVLVSDLLEFQEELLSIAGTMPQEIIKLSDAISDFVTSPRGDTLSLADRIKTRELIDLFDTVKISESLARGFLSSDTIKLTENLTERLQIYFDYIALVDRSYAYTMKTLSVKLHGEVTGTWELDVLERGFDWWYFDEENKIEDSWTEEGTFGEEVFEHDVTGLKPHKLYYFQAKGRNVHGWTRGTTYKFRYIPALELLAQAIDIISKMPPSGGVSAILRGEVTDLGELTCTKRGFDWGTTDAYGSEWYEEGDFSAEAFEYMVIQLDVAQLYHFRAKAYNELGWAYGADQVFIFFSKDDALEMGEDKGDFGLSLLDVLKFSEQKEALTGLLTITSDNIALSSVITLTAFRTALDLIAMAEVIITKETRSMDRFYLSEDLPFRGFVSWENIETVDDLILRAREAIEIVKLRLYEHARLMVYFVRAGEMIDKVVFQRDEDNTIKCEYREAGQLVAPTVSMKITIRDEMGNVIVDGVGMDTEVTGKYTYEFSPETTCILGKYEVEIVADDGAGLTVRENRYFWLE